MKEPYVIVQNTKTGEKFIAKESYGRKLSRDGYKITSKQGESQFDKDKVKNK